MRNNWVAALMVIMLVANACTPVFAISWKEIFFVFLLIAFLFGPPTYRFIRRLEKFLKSRDK